MTDEKIALNPIFKEGVPQPKRINLDINKMNIDEIKSIVSTLVRLSNHQADLIDEMQERILHLESKVYDED